MFLKTGGYIKDVVVRTTYPNCAVRFEYSTTCGNPFGVKLMDFLRGTHSIPFSLIKLDRTTIDSHCPFAGGKEIWRIGKDCIYAVTIESLHYLIAISFVKGKVAVSQIKLLHYYTL